MERNGALAALGILFASSPSSPSSPSVLSTIRARLVAPVPRRRAPRSFPVWRTAVVCATMEVQRQYKGRKITPKKHPRSLSHCAIRYSRLLAFLASMIRLLINGRQKEVDVTGILCLHSRKFVCLLQGLCNVNKNGENCIISCSNCARKKASSCRI